MHSIRPENLSDRELLRYAELENVNGLPKAWADEILKRWEKSRWGDTFEYNNFGNRKEPNKN